MSPFEIFTVDLIFVKFSKIFTVRMMAVLFDLPHYSSAREGRTFACYSFNLPLTNSSKKVSPYTHRAVFSISLIT